MSHNCRKYVYPVNLDKVASDVVARGIDIAPTRLEWQKLAACLAGHAGENGREAFHAMAQVWPDYSRHDSELCYNRELRKAENGAIVTLNWLARRLKVHGIDVFNARYRTGGKPVAVSVKRKTSSEKKAMKKIDFTVLLKTQRNQRSIIGRNALTDMLLNLYPQARVLLKLDAYLIGYQSFESGMMNDAIIFWQVDDKKRIINGKRIYYNRDMHRDKRYPPHILYPENGQCLFGLHMLEDNDRFIGLVESEKSALVMSLEMPDLTWMACGSMNNFTREMLEPIKEKQIIAFPDLDSKRSRKGVSVSLQLWQDKARELNSEGFKIKVDTTLEENATMPQRLAKMDIADVALDKALERFKNSLKR